MPLVLPVPYPRRSTVPESKGRKKAPYTPPPAKGEKAQRVRIGSPRWIAPTMVTLFCIGLAYIVVYYIAGNQVPVMKDLSPLVNVLIGFGFIGGGFIVSTRWR
jgi:hypothetical protein